MSRRRLGQWEEDGEKQYGVRIKPFWLKKGTYGYQSDEPDMENVMRWGTAMSSVDVITTWLCILSTSKVDAVAALLSGFTLNQTLGGGNWIRYKVTGKLSDLFRYESYTNGFSGVFSYNGGWLLAQYLFAPSARNRWAPLVGGLFILMMNITAWWNEREVNHFAHFMGMAQGFVVGSAMAFARPKKVGVKFLQKHDKWLALAVPGLYFSVALIAWLNVPPELVKKFYGGGIWGGSEDEV